MQNPQWYAAPQAPTPGPTPESDDANVFVEPGGFGIRAGAHVIDVIATATVGAISGVVGGIFIGILAAAGVVAQGWEHRVGKQAVSTFVFGLIASLAYHTVAEALGGATVGKAICGLRVLTEDRRPCTFLKSLGRNVAYYFDALFFGAVAWSSMSKSMMKQRHGDKWAGTIVVHARGIPESARRSPVVGIVVGLLVYAVIDVFALVFKML
jgi:uncharacterized RDD family membrane protein YckC